MDLRLICKVSMGTVQQRRASKERSASGWHIFFTLQTSTQNITRAATNLRADGKVVGCRRSRAGALRAAWFDAPVRRAATHHRDLQSQFFRNPSFAPLGLFFQRPRSRMAARYP